MIDEGIYNLMDVNSFKDILDENNTTKVITDKELYNP